MIGSTISHTRTQSECVRDRTSPALSLTHSLVRSRILFSSVVVCIGHHSFMHNVVFVCNIHSTSHRKHKLHCGQWMTNAFCGRRPISCARSQKALIAVSSWFSHFCCFFFRFVFSLVGFSVIIIILVDV